MTSILLICAVSIWVAQAEDLTRATGELGYTNNANLEDKNRDADFYYRLLSKNDFQSGSHALGLRLSYTDYFKQNANDVLSIRLSDQLKRRLSGWRFGGALVSQIYTSGSPANTDTAFTNVGLDLTASRTKRLDGKTELDFGGGYKGRFFTDYDGRNDHTPYIYTSVEREQSRRLSFHAQAEAGTRMSSLADYSMMYCEVSGGGEVALPSRWSVIGDLSLMRTGFLNRTVSTTTLVTTKRGATSSRTSRSIESYQTLFMSGELMRKESAGLQWGFATYVSHQNSRSGLQDFSALDFLARLIMTF